MSSRTVNPHQLDYDWQFDVVTQDALMDSMVASNHILLLGCPSLMVRLDQKSKEGLLLERNPIHLPTRNFQIDYQDIRFFDLDRVKNQKYDVAVVDAPWYPNDLLHWINVALALIKIESLVYFVLWPRATRPGADVEHSNIAHILQAVGELTEVGPVFYEMPPFESISVRAAGGQKNKRFGILFSLKKINERPLDIVPLERHRQQWQRLTFGSNQVAIKVGDEEDPESDEFSFEREPSVLCDTSRRNPTLKMINIWTSDNMVARLRCPKGIARGLKQGSRLHFRFLSDCFNLKYEPGCDVRGVEWLHQE